MARFLLLPALALTGCAGSVALEEAEPFGMVASAVWVHYDDSDTNGLVLSNVAGTCGKLQRLAEATEAWQEASEDVGFDFDDYCSEMKEPYLDLAAAASALYHPGARFLSLTVYDDGDTEPEKDTYEVGKSKALSGSLTYYEETYYEVILRDWDEDADIEDGCGVDEDDLDEDYESLSLADGELEITGLADERSAAGRLEGELKDSDGDDEGDIAASFSATYCEIDP